MKLISITCPHCGARLQATPNAKMLTCDYCNGDFMLDDEVKAKFEIYQILAMQGNAEAQCSLAVYGWKGILMLICRLVGNIIWKKVNRKRMLKNN